MHTPKMTILVLTNNRSVFGKKVMNALLQAGVDVSHLVVLHQPLSYHWGLFKHVSRRVGLPQAAYFALRRMLGRDRKTAPVSWNARPFVRDYTAFNVPLVYARGTNTAKTVQTIKRLQPDILILGQTGILGKELLNIPKIGTLNAHPGVLPYYRGIDCIQWALHESQFDKVGCSVHWVDAGIDTGPIIATVPYRFVGDETLDILLERVEDLAVAAMADTVSALQRSGSVQSAAQNRDTGRHCHKMPRKAERAARQSLNAFLKSHASHLGEERHRRKQRASLGPDACTG